MTTGLNMTKPICLVENKENQLRVNPEALEILEKISQPVVVVAIAGQYRTGKSYLMNHLAGQNHGFRLGYTIKGETKGIWMWCVPHPSRPDHTLVLLDTEGLGDVQKGNSVNDSWIFTLTVLLSSVFIYNSMNFINLQALEQLHYVTELAELIKTKSSPSSGKVMDSAEFVSFFPDFVWIVRDFKVKLELNGHTITEDEYLEHALKLSSDESKLIQHSNTAKECIRSFFPKRKCFTFSQPTKDDELLLSLHKVSTNQLELNFQEQSKKFCSYIFTHSKTKTLREGVIVTGNRLGTLLKSYINVIDSGGVPCLENAMITLAQHENSIAVQKADHHYSEQMARQITFPTDTLQELLDVHTDCEREAIAVFMEHSFRDDQQEFQKKLAHTMEQKMENFRLQNEEASMKYCEEELRKLAQSLQECISSGIFFVPGGHALYLEAKRKIEEDYELLPRKGVKAKEVLQKFLESQAIIEKAILKADKALSDGEKAIAVERTQLNTEKNENEMLRQKLKEKEQISMAQLNCYQKNLAQLKKRMERQYHNQLEEKKMMLMHKRKLLKELPEEGFPEKSEKVKEEIRIIEEMIKQMKSKWPSVISETLVSLGCALFLCPLIWVKAVGTGIVAVGLAGKLIISIIENDKKEM